MLAGTRPSRAPEAYDRLAELYTGDDLMEHFRFIRANVRRNPRAAADEVRVVAGRLVLAAASLAPETRTVCRAAGEALEALADRVERGDPVKQLELDQAFSTVRLTSVGVRWALLEADWIKVQDLHPIAFGERLTGPAEELEHALWLLGADLGRVVEPALAVAHSLVGALQDADPEAPHRVRSELAAARAALELLGIPGIHEPEAG